MENKNLIRFSKLVMHKNKANLILAFIFVCIISIIDLFLPQITRLIIDEGISNENIMLLIKLIILYGLIKFMSSLLNVILSYLYSLMKNRVTINLKIKLLNHISKLSGRYYSNMKTGNTLSIIENDIFVLKNFGAELIFSLLENLITAIVAIFFLVKIRYDLFLIVLALQVSLALIQTKVTKIISKNTKEIREESGEISNITQEYISNIMSIVITKSKLKFFISYLKKERNLAKKFLKLDTIVGEKGIKISGGQKQRIALARALISDNNILILDEATSSLDNISQNTILSNINKYIKDKIVIIIAHRLSTIKSANNIYVLENGVVIESGDDKELFEADGMYKKLVKSTS